MKKLLIVLGLFISLVSQAQITPPSGFIPRNVRENVLGVIMDSVLGIPIRDTAWISPAKVGEMRYRQSDSTVYICIRTSGAGKKWQPVSGGTSHTEGWGIDFNAGVISADSTATGVASWVRLKKVADSLGALINTTIPTLQQVLDAGSTITSNALIEGDYSFSFNNTGGFQVAGVSDIFLESVYEYTLQIRDGFNISRMNATADNLNLSVNNEGIAGNITWIQLTRDSIQFFPREGILNIDSLRSWSDISDTAYKKPMTWDTRNGRWEYLDRWPSQAYLALTDIADSLENYGWETDTLTGLVVIEGSPDTLRIDTTKIATRAWVLAQSLGGGSSYTIGNGLTDNSGEIILGGTLTDMVLIGGGGTQEFFMGLNASKLDQFHIYANSINIPNLGTITDTTTYKPVVMNAAGKLFKGYWFGDGTGGGGGATTLDGLTDVVITAAATGEIIYHNGTNWVDQSLSGVAILNGTSAQTSASFNVDGDGTVGDDMFVGDDLVFNGTGDQIDFAGDVQIQYSATNTLKFQNATIYYFDNDVLPFTNNIVQLGSFDRMWSDLYLGSGAVINFNNGDVTFTHASNAVTVAGGDFFVPTEVYGAGWDGDNSVPTKDALYDKIETLSAGGGVTGFTDGSGFDGTVSGSNLSLTTTLTTGSVPFIAASGVLSQDNAAFFWDASTDRLGLGTATPSFGLHLYENTTETTNAGMRIENAGNGDAVLHFRRGTAGGSIGLDQSNSDRLVISYGGVLGTTNGVIIASDGSIGLAGAAPSAKVTIPAGSGAAFGAPMKFAAATLNGTPENYTLEVTTTQYYLTNGSGVRYQITNAGILDATNSWSGVNTFTNDVLFTTLENVTPNNLLGHKTSDGQVTTVGVGTGLKLDEDIMAKSYSLGTVTQNYGNTGSGEDNLEVYSVAAGLLAATNDEVVAEYYFTTAANANSKQLKLYFGSDNLATIPALSSNITYKAKVRIIRTGAATQEVTIEYTNGTTGATVVLVTTATQTLSGAIDLKWTAEAVADNDIVQTTSTKQFNSNN